MSGKLDLMKRKIDVLFLVILGIAISFSSFTLASGQNTTSASESFAGAGTGVTMAIVSLIIAVSSIIKSLVDKGILDKRVGTVAIMAGDASYAVKDSRQLIYDGIKNTYEVIQSTNPEAAQVLSEKVQPVVDKARTRLEEYQPKVAMISRLAKKLSTSKTEGIQVIAGQIPDEIVP